MQRILLLACVALFSACSYTGHALRNAGAGGTGPAADSPPPPVAAEPDPRFRDPVRPGVGPSSVR